MKRPLFAVIGAAVAAAAVIASTSLFVINQAEQALVLRMGAPRAVLKEPGLYMKWPLIEDVVRYDARLLSVDPPAEQIILGDQKRVEVDTFTRYRIADSLQFYQAMRNEANARARLQEVISATVRRVLGNVMLQSLLSDERNALMKQIEVEVTEAAKPMGIAVVDVRIRRADLPESTSQAIYERMKSEREREAREFRAQGAERAQQIRSRAERERTVILAEAQRQGQILRGQGDAEANRVYAQAYGADPQFFALWRSLQAYKAVLADGNTPMVLSPDSEFFRYFQGRPERR